MIHKQNSCKRREQAHAKEVRFLTGVKGLPKMRAAFGLRLPLVDQFKADKSST